MRKLQNKVKCKAMGGAWYRGVWFDIIFKVNVDKHHKAAQSVVLIYKG